MERIIIQNKIDIMNMLLGTRRDLRNIRNRHFDKGIVTKESWEASPSSRISYCKSKIPMLKAAGVMKDPKDFEYGWHFPNDYYIKVNRELTDADKLLGEILSYLQDYSLRPKLFRFTDEELRRFEVIEGGEQDSWIVAQLKGGGAND